MSVDFPTARWWRLVASVDAIADGRLASRVLATGALTVGELARKGFDSSKDPSGTPWRRLARPRPRGRPNRGGPLYDSGSLRLLASLPAIEGDAIVLHVVHPGAVAHYYGTSTIPMRRYLPSRGLPAAWRDALERDADKAFRGAFL